MLSKEVIKYLIRQHAHLAGSLEILESITNSGEELQIVYMKVCPCVITMLRKGFFSGDTTG